MILTFEELNDEQPRLYLVIHQCGFHSWLISKGQLKPDSKSVFIADPGNDFIASVLIIPKIHPPFIYIIHCILPNMFIYYKNTKHHEIASSRLATALSLLGSCCL